MTDSEYLYDAMTRYIDTWKRNGWKTAGHNDVANQEQLKRLDKLITQKKNKVDVAWSRCPREKPNLAEADKLAKRGMRRYKPHVKAEGYQPKKKSSAAKTGKV